MKKLLFSMLIFGATIVSASELKFGYVNVDRVFAEANPAVEIQKSMKEKFANRQTQLQQQGTSLQSEQQNIQAILTKSKNNDINTLSKADKKNFETLQKQFAQDQMKFQQNYTLFQQDIQHAQEISSSILLNETQIILKNISEKNGFDLVVTSQQLVYAKPKYDITDELLQQLNKTDTKAMLKKIDDAIQQTNYKQDNTKSIANTTK